MKMSKGQAQASVALLTLALGVSNAFVHVAGVPSFTAGATFESNATPGVPQLSVIEKAKFRATIKAAMTQLRELNSNLHMSCMLIMTEYMDLEARQSEPFTQVTKTLRDLEIAMANKWQQFSGMPIIGDEVLALRKALATARSRAAQNSMLIQQLGNPVETIETETDISGIGGLATMTSERLLKLVS
ncbi:hypothetical protein [Pseudomonas sp. AU10]|uniref:hypothetical protein n=1 Tax=Pseudomonas sp. AU10 TaxID=882697 RepID=UPI0021E21055|nr:hypothetical protein [Pseudomonas sp. AU10]MCV2227430.1 hypothetical protein [Pseudomonas sp. AU10]